MATNNPLGIDVSIYQDNINWKKVRASGIFFAFIKASEGATYRDANFRANWSASRSQGVMRGAYHFFRPNSSVAAQVENFLSAVGPFEPGDLPPVLDVEIPSAWGASKKANADKVVAWLEAVEARTGMNPILYMSYYFAQDVLGSDPRLANYPLWVAAYGSSIDAPAPLPRWTFWQYTDSGTVFGINGDVDMNQFNGSLEQLRKFQKPGKRLTAIDRLLTRTGLRKAA